MNDQSKTVPITNELLSALDVLCEHKALKLDERETIEGAASTLRKARAALAAAPAPTAEPVALVARCRHLLQDCLDALGPCDHSVGICNCDLTRTIEECDEALARGPAAGAQPAAWIDRADLAEALPEDGWCVVRRDQCDPGADRNADIPLYPAPTVAPTAAPAEPLSDELLASLRWAVDEVDSKICAHEETHRGGAIWTICDGCGKKWADDRGGFKPYEEPPELTKARELLARASAAAVDQKERG